MNIKPRILAVDDEQDVRLIIKATLEPDYEVFEAQDGLDALEKVDRVEPDLVILDIMMPLMDGYDTCVAIKKNPRFVKTPVMFLSALTEKEAIKKGYISGANLYLTKPFEPERLKKNIDLFFQQTPHLVRQKKYDKEQIGKIETNIRTQPSAPVLNAEQISRTPIQRPAQKSPEAKSQNRIIPRVMVVDDDENIFDYILLTLRNNYEVVWAKDGFQAVEKIVVYDPDIMLLDVMIPKVSGYQLCSSIRKNKAFGAIPIIMISAKGEKKDIDYGYRMGANSYLVKPFEPQELIDVIEHFVNQPTFQIKQKKMQFRKILEIENQQEDKFAGDDAKFVQRLDETDGNK